MRLLLDTHALIWLLQGARQLSVHARQAVLNSGNDVWMSAVSAYEYQLQVRLRRITAFPQGLIGEAAGIGVSQLAIGVAHADLAGAMPLFHRDPWDRVIAAQALIEGMTVVTRDPAIAALGAPTLW